ncbi:nickel pincer cofactor biosynthesis protein LarB [Methanobrevibacter sp. DSM 116169]|uniref:nickel pincer cofactor biosynthesis protein LarB n=1 Tax=Methanobrevibacter sp. DSM 116169 TaxID=3242727 RepID=UPI0038FC7EEB
MRNLLEKLLDGKITLDQCETLLKAQNIQELGDNIKLDLKRKDRTGFPEAIFAENKSDEDIILIINSHIEKNDDNLIITRLDSNRFDLIKDEISSKDKDFKLIFNKKARILIVKLRQVENKDFKVGIITAGTSDIPVGEEAKVIIEESGHKTITSYDIGVAGIHRLFPQISKMIEEDVKVLIVCAGMEGALPSVVAGLVDIPVIGVPTSVGYGVGEGGIAALYSMLQSCAPGIAVVNIDNGFGAGVFALSIVNNL